MGAFPKGMRMTYGKRVEWRCERCGKKYGEWMLEFHHVLPTFSGGTDTYDNMELLCLWCHYYAHVDLARKGVGHRDSPRLIMRRIKKYGGRTKKWLEAHKPC
jgi:5-methylcytosine-specific restriction endonuclease McrA